MCWFPKAGFIKDMLRVVLDLVEVSSELCTGEVDLWWHPRSQWFTGGERSFESSVVEMVTAHTLNQDILHPANAGSLFPLGNPFLSNHVSLRPISIYEVLYVGINIHWFICRSLSIYVYFCVFPLQEVKCLCFHVGTSEEICCGFPSKKCLLLDENSLQGQRIFESNLWPLQPHLQLGVCSCPI